MRILSNEKQKTNVAMQKRKNHKSENKKRVVDGIFAAKYQNIT